MTADRWQRVEALLAEALDHDAATRAAFLDQACAGDQPLRDEIESLLAFENAAEQVVAGAVEGVAALIQTGSLGFEEGDRLGAYRVIREIGRGGMGTVYLAERSDDEFHKQAAIKLVTRGMDTAALLQRFRQERQILARLDHPYIARLLDGGSTEDGRPYLVMEFVEGEPITKWCKTANLTTRQRVELFRKVCAAVQSAHQNLIVHRDLKPGNILVNAEGSPKLLDFGIAKLLDAEDAPQFTIAAGGVLMFTPDYASPEQVRGEPITTSSDVYSLGAILYELVAGVRPHRIKNNSLLEIERAVCTEVPQKPSTASRRAAERDVAPMLQAGDLDNIILMAMQKEPGRRYASAAELSEDLRRYLADLPVQAREDTLPYRARKFVRRHVFGVAASILLTAALAAGVTFFTIEARRAQRRFQEVRRIAHALLYDMNDAIRDLKGSTKAREVMVKTALQYLSGLAREAGNDPGIQLELAEAYQRVGDVQGNAISNSLGQTGEALVSYRKAVQIADDLASRHPDSLPAAFVRMHARERIADINARRSNNLKAALDLYREAIEIGEAIERRDPSNRENLGALSSLYVAVAREDTDSARAIDSARKALPILQQLVALDPANDDARQRLSDGYSMLGQGLLLTNQLPEALEELQKAVQLRENLAAAHPDNGSYQRELMIAYSKVGDLLGPVAPSLDDPTGAVLSYRAMLAIADKLAAADPANRRAAFDRGMALLKTGYAMPASDNAAAEATLQHALTTFQSLAKIDPGDRHLQRSISMAHFYLARRASGAGDSAGAIHNYREAVRVHEAMFSAGSIDLRPLRGIWSCYQELAKAQAARNQRSDALELIRKGIAAAEAARSVDPTNAVVQAQLPQAYAVEGAVLSTLAVASAAPVDQRRSDWSHAAEAFRKSAAAWEQIHPQHGWPKDRDVQLSRAREEAARCDAVAAGLRQGK